MAEEAQVAIIGAGPAGIAAAIYLQRAGHSPLVLERRQIGGLLRSANLVENYPGFAEGIRGLDLVARFADHLESLSIKPTKANVKQVNAARGAFRIRTDSGHLSARAVIVATGTRPKKAMLRGMGGPAGRKVFSELTDLPLENLKGKHIVVIGGADAAFDYALNLRGRGNEVTIISRSEPRCLSLLRARAERGGIDVVIGLEAQAVRDEGEGIVLRCRCKGGRVRIKADGILLACGREPNIEVLSPGLRERIGRGGKLPETNVPGLFIAGDVVRGVNRQTGIAVGDGIRAAMLASEYLKTKEGSQ